MGVVSQQVKSRSRVRRSASRRFHTTRCRQTHRITATCQTGITKFQSSPAGSGILAHFLAGTDTACRQPPQEQACWRVAWARSRSTEKRNCQKLAPRGNLWHIGKYSEGVDNHTEYTPREPRSSEVLQVPRTVDSLILSILKGSQNVRETIVSGKAEGSSAVYT